MYKLIGTNEILGSLAKSVSEDQFQAIINDVKAEVITVSNSVNEVHLTLPYYAEVEDTIAEAISDVDTSEIVGGEVGFSIAAAITIGTASLAIGGIALGMGGRDIARHK